MENNGFQEQKDEFYNLANKRHAISKIEGEESPLKPVNIDQMQSKNESFRNKSVSSTKKAVPLSNIKSKKSTKNNLNEKIALFALATAMIAGGILYANKNINDHNEAIDNINEMVATVENAYSTNDEMVLSAAIDNLYNNVITVEEEGNHRQAYVIWLMEQSASDDMKETMANVALEHYGYTSMQNAAEQCGMFKVYDGVPGKATEADMRSICSGYHEKEIKAHEASKGVSY